MYRNAEQPSYNWLKSLAAPVLSAIIAATVAGFTQYVGIQKEMVALTSNVTRMSNSIEKLTTDQDTFFKSQYLPLMIKVEKQQSEIAEMRANVSAMKEEVRMYHPVRPAYDRQSKY